VGQSQRLAVSFPADDGERVGYLYLPAPNQNCRQRAGVVLCGGFGSTMERLYPHAAAFAAAGFTALVFDYRNFGHSEGHPRQLVDLSGQLSDIRAAITYLRCRGDVNPDHIVLWGNSLGGAHVISVAAEDPLIAAVIAQIPFNGFPRRVAGRSGWDTTRLLGAILWDQLRGVLRLPPYYIPLVGEPGRVAVTNATEANELVATLPDGNTLWQNRTAPRALLRMMRYHPSKAGRPGTPRPAQAVPGHPLHLLPRRTDSAVRARRSDRVLSSRIDRVAAARRAVRDEAPPLRARAPTSSSWGQHVVLSTRRPDH
jgi:uncharacterized protein